MRKKNILDKKIKSIVTRVLNESKPLNEQFGIFCCEPGLCQCQPEFNPGTLPCNGNTAYTQLEDCQNDAGNCCTRWDCDPLGPGICYAPAVNNAAAPFASENDCLTTYPSGCTRTDNDYDCNQQTGNVCGVFVGGPFASENDCLNTYPNGCPQIEDAYECDIPNCQCVVDVNGSFTGVNALTNCTAALADPASECCCEGPCGEMFDCVTRQTAGPVCVPSPTGPFSDMATCNACIADPNCKDCNDPVPERWNCIDRTIDGVTIKVCVIDPLGVFSQEQDCLNCVADPSCEVCNDPDPGKWDCVEDGIRPGDPVGKQQGRGNVQGGMMPTRGGEKVYEKGMMLRESSANMICIPDANGPFMSEIACIDCVNDPLCPECNKIGTGGWDCTGSGCEPGGCTQVNGGQYSSFQECEEQTDDHYNLGFCDCCCPGQPEGCDAAQLISPVMIHNGEYNGIHGQPFMVGDYNLDLNIAKDKDGPLITQAFRTRMAPCGPSYNAPGGNVKHDCSFWEFISEKKLPNRYQSVVHPYSLGGLASQNAENAWQMAHSTAPASGGTSLGGYPFHDWLPGPDGILGNADDTPMIHATTGLPINPHHGQQSGTAHPRWQRRIEAKIAYVMCLRQNCCMNTDWPDSGMVFSPDM
tara:strand:+ start:266 stop:2182 length:1917 start_codon:yes stop_codon:yes gene_type:complete